MDIEGCLSNNKRELNPDAHIYTIIGIIKKWHNLNR